MSEGRKERSGELQRFCRRARVSELRVERRNVVRNWPLCSLVCEQDRSKRQRLAATRWARRSCGGPHGPPTWRHSCASSIVLTITSDKSLGLTPGKRPRDELTSSREVGLGEVGASKVGTRRTARTSEQKAAEERRPELKQAKEGMSRMEHNEVGDQAADRAKEGRSSPIIRRRCGEGYR